MTNLNDFFNEMTATPTIQVAVGDRFHSTTELAYTTPEGVKHNHVLTEEIVVVQVDPVGFDYEVVGFVSEIDPPQHFKPARHTRGSMAHFAVDNYIAKGRLVAV